MNGRVYGMSGDKTMIAIETDVHGFTIVELAGDADLQIGDEISWPADLATGPQTYRNDGTKRSFAVLMHSHLANSDTVRQQLLRRPA